LADTESPDESPRRAGSTLLRDELVGGSLGGALGAFWVVAALAEARPESPKSCLRGCLVILGLCAVVPCTAAGGYWLGGTAGAVCGGVAGYFVPFIVYGVWVQRTTGWAA